MEPVDAVGWGASLVLFLTLGRQVYVQWRERSTQGVSHWLFLGQITASSGFVVYSFLVDNPVFVATNLFILIYGIRLVKTTWYQVIADFPIVSTGLSYLPVPLGGAIVLLFVIQGRKAGEVSRLTGESEPNVYKVAQRFRDQRESVS